MTNRADVEHAIAARDVIEAEDEPAEIEDEIAVEPEPIQAAPPRVVSIVPPDQQEIQRRRDLVRALFNDFWSDNDEKPPTFADRLNQAEAYLNERLSARGEPWRLDTHNRKLLGLPPRPS